MNDPRYKFASGILKGQPLNASGMTWNIAKVAGVDRAIFSDGRTTDFYIDPNVRPPTIADPENDSIRRWPYKPNLETGAPILKVETCASHEIPFTVGRVRGSHKPFQLTWLDRIRCWLARKSIHVVTEVDYSIEEGDQVTTEDWTLSELTVVSVNWALLAAAVRLGPQGAGIVVWPLWSLKKVK